MIASGFMLHAASIQNINKMLYINNLQLAACSFKPQVPIKYVKRLPINNLQLIACSVRRYSPLYNPFSHAYATNPAMLLTRIFCMMRVR